MQNAVPWKDTAQSQNSCSNYFTPKIPRVQESRTIELFAYISDRQLDEALELLEQSGFLGDTTTLFVLAYTQSCRGVA